MVKPIFIIVSGLFLSCASQQSPYAGTFRQILPETNVTSTHIGFYWDDDTTHQIIAISDSCNNYPILSRDTTVVYPEIARRAGVEGFVKIKVFVDVSGRVTKAAVIESYAELFNRSALDAANEFVYSPYKVDCITKRFVALISFSFVLHFPKTN